LQQFLV